MNKIELIPDIPIWGSGEPNAFDPYSDTIAAVIRGTPPPFTLGIFGNWGTGKTTLMRMVADRLGGPDTPTVWFNAWRFQHEPNLIAPLLSSISLTLETDGTGHRTAPR